MPRLFATLLGALLASAVLTACGSSDEHAAEDKSTRTVQSAYGTVAIPSEPKRIVADVLTVDYLTALGLGTDNVVAIFGAGFHNGDQDYYQHDQIARDGITDPGFIADANVEKVAAARPDLILVPFDQIDGAKAREQLAQIAPLVAVPTSESTLKEGRYGGKASFQDWRFTLRSYGTVLDRQKQAESYIAETERMLKDLRRRHRDTIAGLRVVQAKSTPDYVAVNPITNDKAAIGSILLREVGFREPDAVVNAQADEWGSIELSPENINLLDGDLLFLEVREDSKRHEESPLWRTLNVVRNERVFTVGNHWQVGGAVAAREVLRDIEEALTEIGDGS